MNIKLLLKGIATYIPGLYRLGPSFVTQSTGGTISSRYCYSVWLRHLILAYKNGLPTQPETIAEIGPGDSLGIGLAALISGANKYYAFDIIKYANSKRNLEIFDELVELFENRQSIPDETEFSMVEPYLESYEFPSHVLTDELLKKLLKADRIKGIRNALLNLNDKEKEKNGVEIRYFAPWHNSNPIKEESVDMIYSQAALEHVDDISQAYKTLYRWLKPGGFISHLIDFRSHGTAKEWNGHWAYSDFAWKLIRGKMTYLLNRHPHSTHINLLQQSGFEVICDIKIKNTLGIKKKQLASKFKNIPDEDLVISTAFIQAVKKQ